MRQIYGVMEPRTVELVVTYLQICTRCTQLMQKGRLAIL